MFKFSKRSLEHREGVHPKLVEISDLAIKLTTVDFGIPKTGGLRSAVEQNEIFRAARSMADGYEDKSCHQTGRALDFFAYVDGKGSWEKEHLAIVAAAHLQAASTLGYKLEWGGLWRTFKDFPHVQLAQEEI